jgi:sodium/pantothenate symporter
MRWNVVVPFVAFIVANLLIGLYGQRVLTRTTRERFVDEYYGAGRSLGPIVLAFTLTTSLVSAGTFIGSPALGYTDGLVWLVITNGQILAGFLILGLLGKKFAIVARKIEAYTVVKVLAVRFPHPLVGASSAIIMVVFLTFYMSAQFIGGTRIFETMSGMPYAAALTVMVFTTVIYTGFGGYRAVVLTDTLQGVVMLFGVSALFIALLMHAGGMETLISRVASVDPKLITPHSDHRYSWATIITMGWVLLGIALLGLPHGAVRALTYKNSHAMHWAMVLSIMMMFLFTFIMMFAGTAANAILGPEIDVPDTVIPRLIVALFHPALAGIVLAAPFAAIMSTVSSMLLVCANGLVGDLYVDVFRKELSYAGRAMLDRLTTLGLGLVVFAMALAPPPFLQAIVFYAIGGLASCFLVPLVLGLYWPRANTAGALAAIGLGTASYIVVATFFPRPLAIHDVTWSLGTAAVAMVVVSLATAKPARDVVNRFWG